MKLIGSTVWIPHYHDVTYIKLQLVLGNEFNPSKAHRLDKMATF